MFPRDVHTIQTLSPSVLPNLFSVNVLILNKFNYSIQFNSFQFLTSLHYYNNSTRFSSFHFHLIQRKPDNIIVLIFYLIKQNQDGNKPERASTKSPLIKSLVNLISGALTEVGGESFKFPLVDGAIFIVFHNLNFNSSVFGFGFHTKNV